jgi:AraC-like DNA-binding protein
MDWRIRRAVGRIDTQPQDDLSIPRLAREADLSVSRFAHLFDAELGMSPGRYVRQRRMEFARVLLDETSLPVRDVMRKVGCKDPSHFARDFRRQHGFAPKQRTPRQAG